MEIRLPGGSWDDGILATDTTGFEEDSVTQQNWPWRTWSYSLDMSTQPEADYQLNLELLMVLNIVLLFQDLSN